uniref:AlkB homolog 7 n=1 Tax=Phasianus colchicus TaxID=9054 RepID=A0A669QHZ0_PHACC
MGCCGSLWVSMGSVVLYGFLWVPMGPALRERLSRSAAVFAAFVSPEEGAALLRDAEEALRRRRYEDGHWDGAISGFREAERSRWGAAGAAVLQRMSCAFPPARPPLPHSHILDLAPHGCVRPHIDSTKFCGCTIAGVSLLSAAVMRLRSVRDPREWAELLLEPLSLYGPIEPHRAPQRPIEPHRAP